MNKVNQTLAKVFYFTSLAEPFMEQAALLGSQLGWHIHGSDADLPLKARKILSDRAVQISEGRSIAHLEASGAKALVVSRRALIGHEELAWALKRKLKLLTVEAFLSEYVIGQRLLVYIAGGRHRTSAGVLTVELLKESGLKVGWALDYFSENRGSNRLNASAELGHAQAPFVLEDIFSEDKSFEKSRRLEYLKPTILTLSDLESNHADSLFKRLKYLTGKVKKGGLILLNSDDEKLRGIKGVPYTISEGVGQDEKSNWLLSDFKKVLEGSVFTLKRQADGKKGWGGRGWKQLRQIGDRQASLATWRLKSTLSGLAAIRALALAAVTSGWTKHLSDKRGDSPMLLEGIALDKTSFFKSLSSFRKILFKDKTLLVLSGSEHHPTSVMACLDNIRREQEEAELLVCFDTAEYPHCLSNQADFEETFDCANACFMTCPKEQEDPASKKNFLFSLRARGLDARCFSSHEKLLEAVKTWEEKITEGKKWLVILADRTEGKLLSSYLESLKNKAQTHD